MNQLASLLTAMTQDEKVSLLSGEDFWSVGPVTRLGLNRLKVTDGPNGARGSGSLIGGVTSACFPSGIALGASWDTDLVREIGGALAEETKSKGAHMLLAPTVNIHRSVTNGRNFECYSEDPLLSGLLAAAYIDGLQNNGIGATIKHFAGNESEIERTTVSSEIDERTLREIYLLPFEIAVKASKPWGLMTSYNRLNGIFTSDHQWLITTVLRGEWKYDGIVMSDWFGSHSTVESVNAGLDLEMPGPTRDRGQKLLSAVLAGHVSQQTLDDRASAMLNLIVRTGLHQPSLEPNERADDRPEHRALIRRAGAESAVLLKNTGILPLNRERKIAVIGPNARTAQIMGGGSAQLDAHYRISPWDGLVSALGEEHLGYATGCTNHRFEPVLRGPFEIEFFSNDTFSGEPTHVETMMDARAFWIGRIADDKIDALSFSARMKGLYTAELDGEHRVGIYSAGLSKVYLDGQLVSDAWTNWKKGRTFFEEGCDESIGLVQLEAGRQYEVMIEFKTKPYASIGLSGLACGISKPLGDEDIQHAVGVAASADAVVLCVGRNGEWDTEGSDLASIELPGRQNDLIDAISSVNPNTIVVLQTGGPVEMPWIDKVGAVLQAWYPGQEAGNSIADVLIGLREPGGRLPQTFPMRWADNPTHSQDLEIYPGLGGRVRYEEGVFVGYRHYDRHDITPLYPFGFGLGYTTFAVADLEVDDERFERDGVVVVRTTVQNTGNRAGGTVVQLYVGQSHASVSRPPKELKAFRKVTATPNESVALEFNLDPRSFAYFSTAEEKWVVDCGTFTISVGQSSIDLPLSYELTRKSIIEIPLT